ARKGITPTYSNGSDGEGASLIENEILRRHQLNWEVNYQIAHGLEVGLNYMYVNESGSSANTSLPTVIYSGPHSIGLKLMVGI
ncbi:MAG: hypothetical protein ACPG5W_11795, partial [Flavobacteriales bacterium]